MCSALCKLLIVKFQTLLKKYIYMFFILFKLNRGNVSKECFKYYLSSARYFNVSTLIGFHIQEINSNFVTPFILSKLICTTHYTVNSIVRRLLCEIALHLYMLKVLSRIYPTFEHVHTSRISWPKAVRKHYNMYIVSKHSFLIETLNAMLLVTIYNIQESCKQFLIE